MNFKQFMKNTKGISPIFATLILIAIAVIAGVVVYMFTSGMLAGMTGQSSAGQEKITIQSAQYKVVGTTTGTDDTITLLVQCTSGPQPNPQSIIIKDSMGNTAGTATAVITPTPSAGANPFASGALVTIVGTMTADLTVDGSYTATFVTAAGGSFVSPSFVANVP